MDACQKKYACAAAMTYYPLRCVSSRAFLSEYLLLIRISPGTDSHLNHSYFGLFSKRLCDNATSQSEEWLRVLYCSGADVVASGHVAKSLGGECLFTKKAPETVYEDKEKRRH